MARGTVSSFDAEKGYGSIRPDQSEEELFVHESSVTVNAKPALIVEQVVYFEVLDGPHGRQAVEVRPIQPTPE
jgi:cold shock protein